MKELLVQYATYNAWANAQLLTAISALPEEKQRQQIISSFDSLFNTVLHLLDSNTIWWQRLKLQERIVRPSDHFTGDFRELSQALMQQDRLWLDWVTQAQEHMLQHVFQYQNSRRESFKQPVFQALHHIFNHGTYHRGQLVTMLRQVGVEKLPNTDFIGWSRRK